MNPSIMYIYICIEPHLLSLVKVQHYGLLEQPLWDGILQLRRLQALFIRQTDTLSPAGTFTKPQASAVLVG